MRPFLDRLVQPGDKIPEFRFSGSSYDAGAVMARWTLEKYPFHPLYLSQAVHTWMSMPQHIHGLFQQYAPWISDLYKGMLTELARLDFDADAPPAKIPIRIPAAECTSFSLDGKLCLNGTYLAGQTKDTGIEKLDLYIILNLRLTDGPSILTLAYPGELLGYGFWSNGMSIFRNNLYSRSDSCCGLPFWIYGLLAMASGSVKSAALLAKQEGISGAGHLILSDDAEAVSVEYNAGGTSLLFRNRNGILVHGNHPQGDETARFITEESNKVQASASRSRMLLKNLQNLPLPLTVEALHKALSTHHPETDDWGVCRHGNVQGTAPCTTAALVADVQNRKLYVTKGPACLSCFSAYEMF